MNNGTAGNFIQELEKIATCLSLWSDPTITLETESGFLISFLNFINMKIMC